MNRIQALWIKITWENGKNPHECVCPALRSIPRDIYYCCQEMSFLPFDSENWAFNLVCLSPNLYLFHFVKPSLLDRNAKVAYFNSTQGGTL